MLQRSLFIGIIILKYYIVKETHDVILYTLQQTAITVILSSFSFLVHRFVLDILHKLLFYTYYRVWVVFPPAV